MADRQEVERLKAELAELRAENAALRRRSLSPPVGPADRELDADEVSYQILFAANPHPMWIYDLETLAFLAVNQAAVHRYGYSREDFLGMTLRDIRPPEDIPALQTSVAQGIQGLEKAGIWRHCLRDGRLILVEIISHRLTFDARPAKLVLAHDVTRRLTAEAEVHRLNTQLEQRVQERTRELEIANRELETFAYTVSHDLKAPLRGIDGYSRLLEQDHLAGLDQEGRTFVANVRRGVEQMNRLIDDLLAYARLERRTLQPRALDLNRLVADLAAERRDDIRDCNATLHLDLPPLTLRADAEGLAQVLRNLLDNALKFRGPRPPRITVGARPRPEGILLWVADNGIGFEMKFHDRIFDIFHRLHPDRDYAGTGVGLAIVRRAMERLGGRVRADSRPGRGTTFYLELPFQ